MPDKAQTEMSVPYPAFIFWRKCMIRLSDHFTYAKVLRFALPSVVMMIFTSIYSVVDGFFVSNTDIKFNKLYVIFKAFICSFLLSIRYFLALPSVSALTVPN